MLNSTQLIDYVIKPVLMALDLYSNEAEQQMVGTGLMESGFTFIAQTPYAVALGLWQMEQATYTDLLQRLQKKADLYTKVKECLGLDVLPEKYDYLAGNMYAACTFARLKYYFIPQPIPKTLVEQARYWSQYYNTKNNPDDIQKYINKYRTSLGLG
jgi:hypothetical protein